MARARRLLAPAAVLVGAAVLSGVTALTGIQPNDEGNVLTAAARIAGGEVPYRDFWHFYPPGQLYLLGGLWELTGPSLLPPRVLRVACDAVVALLAYLLARRGGATAWLAMLAALAAALAMAFPSGPHPFPPTLAMALGALLLFERRPVLAGVLTGVAGVWRLEFAAYLGLGIVLAYAVRAGPVRERAATVARFAGAAVVVAAALYAPVVAMAGLARSWDLMIEFPATRFGALQSLPFPLSYDGPLNTGSVSGFLTDSAEPLLLFYLPLVLVAGLLASLAVLAIRVRRDRWWLVAPAVFSIGMAHYLLARPDLFHTAPLAVMGSVLAAWAITAGIEALRATHARRGLGAVVALAASVAGLALGYSLLEGLDRRWLELRADHVPLDLAVADGVRVRADAAAELERVVAALDREVPPDRPIYVTTRRSDQVSSGHPLLYLLAERANPTRYDIQQGGVVTTAPVQREIVCDIERARVTVVVRWDAGVTVRREPNESGRPSGVRVLADYLRAAYRPWRRIGEFTLLKRSPVGGGSRVPRCGP